jgi:CDP-4-dehydro-6-deoxyglucose reductase, E3
VVSDEPADSDWQGRRGLVNQAVLDDYPDLSGYQAYVYGAPAMCELSHQTFVAQGLNAEEFFSYAFTFAPK